MSFNRPIQLATAYPGAEPYPNRMPADGASSKVFLGDISTDEGRKRAFIKMLPINGLVKEALAVVLARSLNLPVKEPYYVNVSSITSPLKNPQAVAFGSVLGLMPAQALREGLPELLRAWPDLLSAGVFDLWVGNADRIPNNILYERGGVFWLIDHDEAFPEYLSPDEVRGTQLLDIAIGGLSEFEVHKLRKDARGLIQKCAEVDWHGIASQVNLGHISGCGRHYRKYVDFLKQRVASMKNMLDKVFDVGQRKAVLPSINSVPGGQQP